MGERSRGKRFEMKKGRNDCLGDGKDGEEKRSKAKKKE